MQSVPLLILSLLFGFFPAQVRQSRVAIERHDDACTGLDEAQCCAQMLEIAGFKATGDQLPRKTKGPVRLSCEAPEKEFTETSCLMLALARGFAAKEASALCEPGKIAKRCQGDSTCKQCVADLDRMSWKAPHRACYAITYVDRPSNDGTKVVSVTRGKNSASANATVVRMRRTVLR